MDQLVDSCLVGIKVLCSVLSTKQTRRGGPESRVSECKTNPEALRFCHPQHLLGLLFYPAPQVRGLERSVLELRYSD